MELRQNTVAAFDSRGGTLKGFDPVGRPCLPLRKDAGGQPLRDGVPVKGSLRFFPCCLQAGFASGATRTSSLVGPIDHGEKTLLHPLPPPGREEEGLQVLVDPLLPEIHEGCQGRHLLADLGHGVMPGRQLMVPR